MSVTVAGNAVPIGTKASLLKTMKQRYGGDVRSDMQTIVSTDLLKRLRYLYKKHPLMEQIRSVLQKSIWSGGVSLYKIDKEASHFLSGEQRIKWTPPPRVQHSLDVKWDHLKYQILDHLLIYGWVVIRFNAVRGSPEQDSKEEPEIVPFVVPVEFYRLCITTSLEGTVLRALNVRDQDEIENCVVFHQFGYDPTPDGRLNSLVSKAAAAITFMMNHETTDLIIRELRCRPTAFVEKGELTKNEATGSALGQRRALLEGLESDTLGYTAVDKMDATNVVEGQIPMPLGYSLEEDMRRNDLMFEKARQKSAMDRGDPVAAVAMGLDKDKMTIRPMGSLTGVSLATGESVKFAPTISEASNFESTRRCMQESIAGVFGVPLSVLTGTGRSGSAQNQATQQTKTIHSMFRLTIQEWRNRLSRILTDCFTECWFDLLMKEETLEKEKSKKTPATAIDPYKEKRVRTVHVDFSPSTFVGNDEIRQLYEWGVIDFKVFGQYCMANCSLPVEEMEKTPPPDNPLGVGLPDPNAEIELKEKELGLKNDELKFKEREAKEAAKREERTAKREEKANASTAESSPSKKRKASSSEKKKEEGGKSKKQKDSSSSKVQLVISTK